MTKLFFSSSSSDRRFADQLRQAMTERGFIIRQPSATLASGTTWAEDVRRTLDSSDALLFVVPEPGSPGANNVFFEVGAASALGKPVLAVMPDRGELRGRDFPVNLVGVLVVDAAQKPIETVVETLAHALPTTAAVDA